MRLFDNTFKVNHISLAVFVKAGTGTPIHKNRPFHGLAYTVKGSKIYYFDNGTNVATGSGDVIYLPKYSSYTVGNIDSGDCYAINFDIDNSEIFEPQNWHFKDSDRLMEVFDASVMLWTSRTKGHEYRLNSLLYEILYLIITKQTNQSDDRNHLRIKPATDYIEHNFTDSQISITALANMCNISDTYFRRLFYECYQTTPLKYLNTKRLELAKRLIESDIYSINEVQKICGYSDPCVFSRAFKAYYRCSPIQYKI